MHPNGRTLGAAAALAMAACSSFDAGAPAPDAGSSGGPVDAAADGPPTGGDASPQATFIPCAMRAVDPARFCDDFDVLPSAVDFRWSRRLLAGGASVGETAMARSTPRALLVRLPAGDEAAYAVVERDRDPGVVLADRRVVRASFALHITEPPFPTPGANAYLLLSSIFFDAAACDTTPGSTQRSADLLLNAAGDVVLVARGFAEKCPDLDYEQTRAPVGLAYFQAAFRRVAVEVARTSCAGRTEPRSLTVAIEGTRAVCLPVAGDPLAHGTTLRFRLGVLADGERRASTFAYDDVTFDIE